MLRSRPYMVSNQPALHLAELFMAKRLDQIWEYILYVDDILVAAIDPRPILQSLKGGTIEFKDGKIKSPETHLEEMHR